MKKVAIFDVDGTIFRSSLLIELVEVMIERKLFDPALRKRYEREQKAWQNREGNSQQGDYEAYLGKVVEVFVENIKGIAYGDFKDAVKLVMERYQYRTYRYTRDLVKELKVKGYFLLAISQSPKGILDEFCKKYGFDKVYGRFYELGPSEQFTGKVIDEHLISNKANILKRAIEREGLTLKGSIGVGDTEGDISFLEMVEKPICFNPNSLLFRHAKRMDWQVVVERKDVIYTIKN